MKTTIEISDALLAKAKAVAAKRKTTLRALVEEGLRQVLKERAGGTGYKLRDTTVTGRGLKPGIREGDWEQIRDLIYEGRGA